MELMSDPRPMGTMGSMRSATWRAMLAAVAAVGVIVALFGIASSLTVAAARTAGSLATRTGPGPGTGACPGRAGSGTHTDQAGTHHAQRCPTAAGRGRPAAGPRR